MNINFMKSTKTVIALSLVSMLTACGGGGGDEQPVESIVSNQLPLTYVQESTRDQDLTNLPANSYLSFSNQVNNNITVESQTKRGLFNSLVFAGSAFESIGNDEWSKRNLSVNRTEMLNSELRTYPELYSQQGLSILAIDEPFFATGSGNLTGPELEARLAAFTTHVNELRTRFPQAKIGFSFKAVNILRSPLAQGYLDQMIAQVDFVKSSVEFQDLNNSVESFKVNWAQQFPAQAKAINPDVKVHIGFEGYSKNNWRQDRQVDFLSQKLIYACDYDGAYIVNHHAPTNRYQAVDGYLFLNNVPESLKSRLSGLYQLECN